MPMNTDSSTPSAASLSAEAEAVRRIFSHGSIFLRKLEMRPGQTDTKMAILELVAAHPLSIKEISEILGIKGPSVSVPVSGLESQGLVTRQVSAADRRVSYVHITEEGTDQLRSQTEKSHAAIQAYLSRIPMEHRLRLMDALAEVEEILLETPYIDDAGWA